MLNPTSRQKLLALGVPRRYQDGETLIRQGASDQHVALLVHGITKVTYSAADGREALLAIRVTGDTQGEMAALTKSRRTATVTACKRVDARVVPPEQFRAFLQADPHAALAFARLMADRLRSATRRRVDFTTYPVQIRVARVLYELASSYGVATNTGVKLTFRITQSEIAALAGAAGVTGQKALRELRDLGLIQTVYGGVVVRDLEALRIVAKVEKDEFPPTTVDTRRGQT